MKPDRVLITGGLLLCASVFQLCAGTTVDADGRFSATFPGPVSISSQPTGKSTLHIVNFDQDDMTSFFVMYGDQPEGTWARLGGIDKAYVTAANGAMKAQKASLLSQGVCNNGDLSGSEFRFNISDKKLVCRVRYYIVGNRLYQVMYVGSPGTETGAPAVAFLDSFRVLSVASH